MERGKRFGGAWAAAALCAMLVAAAPNGAMGYDSESTDENIVDSCRYWSMIGSTFGATCNYDDDGEIETKKTSMDLDDEIGNKDGKLSWEGTGYSDSCGVQYLIANLESVTLKAQCGDFQGGTNWSTVVVSDKVINDDGDFAMDE